MLKNHKATYLTFGGVERSVVDPASHQRTPPVHSPASYRLANLGCALLAFGWRMW
jgi:hypothetical protein